MSEAVKQDYPCSMGDLYSIMETGWGNYKVKVASFTAFKGIYNAGLATTALAAIGAAKTLPDDAARSAAAETLRVGLVKMSKTCLLNFRMLKSYIETAFTDSDLWAIQFSAAGQDYYDAAGNEDWEGMESLLSSAKNYLTTNTTLLLGVAPNLNMPAAFPATFTTAATAFSTQYGQFKAAMETSAATAAKITANNACYKTFMSMMKDGQLIFANDFETKKLFVFNTIWDMINPPKSGIKGMVKASGTNEPLGGASLKIQKEGEVAITITTDDDGSYSQRLSVGKFTVTVMATGFANQTKSFELQADGYKTIDFEMVV